MSDQTSVGPEWARIAPAAHIPSQELATCMTQAVMMMAVLKAKQGESVSLNLKFGKLTLAQGQITFVSDRLQITNPQGNSAMSIRRYAEDYEDRSPSPMRTSVPTSNVVSPRGPENL